MGLRKKQGDKAAEANAALAFLYSLSEKDLRARLVALDEQAAEVAQQRTVIIGLLRAIRIVNRRRGK